MAKGGLHGSGKWRICCWDFVLIIVIWECRTNCCVASLRWYHLWIKLTFLWFKTSLKSKEMLPARDVSPACSTITMEAIDGRRTNTNLRDGICALARHPTHPPTLLRARTRAMRKSLTWGERHSDRRRRKRGSPMATKTISGITPHLPLYPLNYLLAGARESF